MSKRRLSEHFEAFEGLDGVWEKLLLEDVQVGLWVWDVPGNEIRFLGGDKGTLGIAAGELPSTAEAWSELVHPDDLEKMTKELQQAVQEAKECFSLECRLRRLDGTWAWRRMSCRIVERDADGGPTLMAGALLDVSEWRQAEAALQESEHRYRTLVESQGEGIGIVDEQERFTFANPAADQIFGVSPGSLVGKSLQELIPREEFDRILEQTSRRKEGERSTYEVDFVRQDDGRRRTLLVTATPQRRHDGTTYGGAFGVFRDITERKEAEDRRMQLEERLQQTAKMESLGQLAGGVAHDFNNLLSPILGYSELILADLDPSDPVREDILEIEEAAQRARDLTRQLTAFGRRQVLRVTVVSLNEFISRTYEMLRRLIREDIDIILSLAPDLCNTRADEGQLQQILLNLTLNARDAILGSGTIRIETANVALGAEQLPEPTPGTGTQFVRLTVRDNGMGMEPEVRERIFEPFFSTKPKYKGTGLGLATVHGIVRQHEGVITVDSVLGEGTAVHVYLPRTDEKLVVPRATSETIELAEYDETVLVVEDEAAVRRHVCRTLRRSGFTVLEARGGSEALALAEAHEGDIELLVTDVVMPQMNGPEVYRAVRKLRPEIRVVYMSGYTGDALGERGILDEATIFLQKPFTRRALMTKIEEALGR